MQVSAFITGDSNPAATTKVCARPRTFGRANNWHIRGWTPTGRNMVATPLLLYSSYGPRATRHVCYTYTGIALFQ